mgnify:CR=1 FL=1
MSKKLLASLMAGVMLFSQGTSLGAVKPNQGGFSGFWKSNKSFILGGASLAGLAGGVAYLIHTHNVPRVEGMECPKNFEDSKIREDFFKKPQKNRKHDTGVDGFYPEFPSTGKEADDQKNYIQDHGDSRQRQWYKVG